MADLRGSIPLRHVQVLFLAFLWVSPALAQASDRRIAAARIESAIVVDGNLDEPEWQLVEPAGDFIQKEPRQGEPATEPTEVRLLYNDDTLYLGVFCFDSAGAEGIVLTDITRDYSDSNNDHFAVVLDTFDDDRNGFLFGTNPGGAKRDAQFGAQGSPNFDWDGIWHVKSRITESGWQVEMAIPLKTLRFRAEELQNWGINFVRRVRRKNEDSHWSPVPRGYRVSRVQFAGTLEDVSGMRQGRNLNIKPFLSAPVTRREGDDVDFMPEVGLDVKYGVTPGLTLDLTLNTDFAQVEADEQQINLTRFSLFFPEKREFFLENAAIFQFGKVSGGFGPGGDLIPFFSRRIGISEGELIPILGGARLTGRVGRYTLGLLSIQADELEPTPSTNFSVVRLRRDILNRSEVGGIFINKYDTDGRFNRTFGADLNLRFLTYLELNSSLLKTDTPGLAGQDWASDFTVTWNDPKIEVEGRYLSLEDNFNPEVGFAPRVGIRKSRGKLAFKPRPESISWIREFKPLIALDYITDQENTLETRKLDTSFTILFEDTSNLVFVRLAHFERLDEPFFIRPGQPIPVGDYNFDEYVVSFASDQSRVFSGNARITTGAFFDGDKDSYSLGFLLQLGYRFSSDVSWSYDDVRLPSGDFTTNLVSTRLRYSFSTTMFLNALIQYNSTLKEFSSNIRFNFIYKPLSDFFLVYNERRSSTGEVLERALIAKLTYLFGF
ncbi:MAG: DUF5916 domain-containing protein [Spirochaetia bacterium]